MIQERDDVVGARLGDHPAPAHVGGVGPPRGLHRSAGAVPGQVQAALPRGPPARGAARGRAALPGLRRRAERAARLQPDVRDARSARSRRPARRSTCGRRRRRASSSTSRPRCSTRAASRRSASRRSASRSATRSRPATSSSARASSSRWRWSSSCRPTRPASGTTTGAQARMDWYVALGIDRERLRLRDHDEDELSHYSSAHRRHRVPVPDRLVGAGGHRQPRRLRPHAARGGLGREARVLRPADARALHPARDRAGGRRRPHACWRSCATPTTRTRSAARSAPCCGCTRAIAPVKVAVLPLLRKDGHPERAREIYEELRAHVSAEYDDGRPHRQALPAPGRDRHAAGASRSTTRRSRTARSRCATATRSRRTACRRRAELCDASHVNARVL